MKKQVLMLAGLLFSLGTTSFASQQLIAADAVTKETNPLSPLAIRYEKSVKSFQTIAKRVRGIDRADQTLVNRLNDAAERLTKAAKNPRYLNQLYYRLRDVLKLHNEVEARFLAKYTLHHDLLNCWQSMNLQLVLFFDEYIIEVDNPRHTRNVQRVRSSNSRREKYLKFESPLPKLPLLPSNWLLRE
ncbi:MAG: hypothetical protein P8L85_09495 [Rubripirellula sp.]|nr:hypothetical protein [Rubripirellula sp.]